GSGYWSSDVCPSDLRANPDTGSRGQSSPPLSGRWPHRSSLGSRVYDVGFDGAGGAAGAVGHPVAGPHHALAVARRHGMRLALVTAAVVGVLVHQPLHRLRAVQAHRDDLVVEALP